MSTSREVQDRIIYGLKINEQLLESIISFVDDVAKILASVLQVNTEFHMPGGVTFIYYPDMSYAFIRNGKIIFSSRNKNPEDIYSLTNTFTDSWLRAFEKQIETRNQQLLGFHERIGKFSEVDDYPVDNRGFYNEADT